jgi:hypothetical protein
MKMNEHGVQTACVQVSEEAAKLLAGWAGPVDLVRADAQASPSTTRYATDVSPRIGAVPTSTRSTRARVCASNRVTDVWADGGSRRTKCTGST